MTSNGMSQRINLSGKTRFSAYMAASIDGRIAKDGSSGAGWTSGEDRNFFQKSLDKADVVIAGRNTYNVAKNRLKLRNTIVLTSKVNSFKVEGRTVFLNPQKFNLKKFLQNNNYKKTAIVGGARVYDFCLRNKMLDELFVTIEPYVFTAGVPMFAGDNFKKYNFILESVKKINKKGAILIKYKIRR